ncbi:hypothetical protein [Burkholderia sp. WAC0059]|uniref:hypothetical protein n=1 Tax=Burkholderia sp. WAC0059 TaxID=2066022 RepID=UPI0021550527|nr:hypothetical protein [Burkholderia sp. WAC0059]
MKLRVFLVFVLCIAITGTYAESSLNQATVETRQQPDPVYSFGKCNFQIHDLEGGLFATEGGSGAYTYLELENGIDIEAGFYCRTGASPGDVAEQLDARKIDGRWIWSGSNQAFEKSQHFRTYELVGKSWKGLGNTYDQTTGDEATRRRLFNFCLRQTDGPQILCVNTPIMTIDTSRSNMLPKIMAVLKSIEFADLPASAGASAASSATDPGAGQTTPMKSPIRKGDRPENGGEVTGGSPYMTFMGRLLARLADVHPGRRRAA